MANNETIIAQVDPCCYCCLSETNLTEYSNGKGLVYWLCDDCQDAGFKRVDGDVVLVCPCHSQRNHYDVENHDFLQKRAKAGHHYNYPVHTRRTKEQGLKPMFGLARYEEIKPI